MKSRILNVIEQEMGFLTKRGINFWILGKIEIKRFEHLEIFRISFDNENDYIKAQDLLKLFDKD